MESYGETKFYLKAVLNCDAIGYAGTGKTAKRFFKEVLSAPFFQERNNK